MGKTFIITPQAQEDFSRAYRWYEDQYQGLGKEFARSVDAKMPLFVETLDSMELFSKMKFGGHWLHAFLTRYSTLITKKYLASLPFCVKAGIQICGNLGFSKLVAHQSRIKAIK